MQATFNLKKAGAELCTVLPHSLESQQKQIQATCNAKPARTLQGKSHIELKNSRGNIPQGASDEQF